MLKNKKYAPKSDLEKQSIFNEESKEEDFTTVKKAR
jgi:hypothetical protein